MKTEKSFTKITATLRGIRPILFDRYGGTNTTQLAALEKLYLNEAGLCGIPVLNMFSLLSAQNTPSVAKRFYGKQGRDLAMAVQAYVNIEAADTQDPLFAPILGEDGKPFKAKDPRIKILNHVARLKDGIPNPKERPMIPKGWSVKFQFEIDESPPMNVATLKKMVEQGGIIGLGTFRPVFGRYSVEWEN